MKISDLLSDCNNIAADLNEIGGEKNPSAEIIVRDLNHIIEQLQALVSELGDKGENIVFPKKVELDSEVKKKLRRMYAEYHTQYEYGDWVNEGGWGAFSAWQQSVLDDMKLLSGLDDIDDIGANIWTANQMKFARECQDDGHEINWTYSGRGMFGAICPAVRCDSENEIHTTAKYQTDGMGLGVVCYAQY